MVQWGCLGEGQGRGGTRRRKGKFKAVAKTAGACEKPGMSLPRFHLPPGSWPDGDLVLSGDEARHCARVLRRQVGDAIEIFDGAGRVVRARLTTVARETVTAAVVEELPTPARPPAVHLLPALIKTEPFEWLLEKAVELGAASVRPVLTARTVVQPDGEKLDKKMARWRRHMLEAAKQCHTPFLPDLATPKPFAEALAAAPAGALKILPSLAEASRTLHGLGAGASEAWVAIGPEGDFTPAEEELARGRGFLPVTLGPFILRAETASLTALTLLVHEMGRGRADV